MKNSIYSSVKSAAISGAVSCVMLLGVYCYALIISDFHKFTDGKYGSYYVGIAETKHHRHLTISGVLEPNGPFCVYADDSEDANDNRLKLSGGVVWAENTPDVNYTNILAGVLDPPSLETIYSHVKKHGKKREF